MEIFENRKEERGGLLLFYAGGISQTLMIKNFLCQDFL